MHWANVYFSITCSVCSRGIPSTLSCHVAVKPTICDMLLSHEKLGTDTFLPTPSESREYSLGSLTHTGFVC